MRWNNLLVESHNQDTQEELPLGLPGAQVRTFPTPEFKGMTFYEIRAKSIINRVPKPTFMPYTINPYRGCTHKCRYCFARPTHDYIGLNMGEDFDTKVVVKVNAPELLKVELSRPSWGGDSIAMGTNVDPYQRAEGKYRLMRGIIKVLVERRNPFSILTKGTLILRDLDLLQEAAKVADVSTAVSVGSVDSEVWRQVEAGAPRPQARIEVCRKLNESGIRCNVLMAPVLPYITDSDEQLEATISTLSESGAASITPLALHLRPGVREWYMSWLAESKPELVKAYERLYARGAYVPKWYSEQLSQRVSAIKRAYGFHRRSSFPAPRRRLRESGVHDAMAEDSQQLSLL